MDWPDLSKHRQLLQKNVPEWPRIGRRGVDRRSTRKTDNIALIGVKRALSSKFDVFWWCYCYVGTFPAYIFATAERVKKSYSLHYLPAYKVVSDINARFILSHFGAIDCTTGTSNLTLTNSVSIHKIFVTVVKSKYKYALQNPNY